MEVNLRRTKRKIERDHQAQAEVAEEVTRIRKVEVVVDLNQRIEEIEVMAKIVQTTAKINAAKSSKHTFMHLVQ